jgi:hypothetical protein
VRGQQSDLSAATTSYALPSIHAVFPNGTAPVLGQRKDVIPTAGGVIITLFARNLGHLLAPRTTLSLIYRGVQLDTPMTPNIEWILQTSEVAELQSTIPPREAVSSATYTNETDGIRCVTFHPPSPSHLRYLLRCLPLIPCGSSLLCVGRDRYQRVETLLSSDDVAGVDTVRVEWFQAIYSVQWRLLAGEGEKQTLQFVSSEGLGLNYYSNIVTIDYELPLIDRVVTSQYVAW